MSPTVDEMQHGINHLVDRVLEVSKGIAWQKKYSSNVTKDKGLSLSVYTERYMNMNCLYKFHVIIEFGLFIFA